MSVAIERIVRDINKKFHGESSMVIGETIRHPNGYLVKVIDGQYLDPVYGRLSNSWTWRRVKKDGSLGKEEKGYGW